MSINLDKPSIAGADLIGLFRDYDAAHGYEPGYTRSVVARFSENNRGAPGNTSHDAAGSVPPAPDPEEQAILDFFKAESAPDRWKAHVAEADVGTMHPPDKFDPNKDYGTSKPGVKVDDPGLRPYAGGKEGSGDVAVSTEAILHFADMMGKLVPPSGGIVGTATNLLQTADLRPGRFAAGEKLRRDLFDSTGLNLRGSTLEVLGQVQDIFAQLQTDIRKLIAEYDSAEELNSLTSDKLGRVFTGSDAQTGKLNSLGDVERESGD